MKNRALLPIASLLMLLGFLSVAARPASIEAAPAAFPDTPRPTISIKSICHW